MSVLIYRDAKAVGVAAATMIAAHLLQDPGCVLGVDYHETLLPVYDSLSAMTENGLLNWGDAKVFQLFEFLPDERSEQRIANLLGKSMFAKTDISEDQYTVPFSKNLSVPDTVKAFEQKILSVGGIDAALIAVRQDGSLLMNRLSDCTPETHVETIEGDGYITAGLATIMQSKHPIVVALGKKSAQAVKAMLKGNLSDSPLAALRLHSGATFVLDEDAAELL